MTGRIFRAASLAAVAAALACTALILGVLYTYFTNTQYDRLAVEAELAARGVSRMGTDFFTDLETGQCRITWIGADGAVLYDSTGDPAAMENHLDREEVREALELGKGESLRYSTTRMERYLYFALRLEDGSVIRLSMEQDSVWQLLLGLLQPVCAALAVALVLALVLASRSAKQIVRPMNGLDLDNPLKNGEYEELKPLLCRIDAQQRQLRAQEQELGRRRQEFDTLIRSMSEGFVLLDGEGRVLSLNPTAARLLGADNKAAGKDIFALSRDPEVQELVAEARRGRRGETVMALGGGEYQLDVGPVLTGDTVTGVVMLFFDVSEKSIAEQQRREFTANVSHELKTPLHTISGCAELLVNGLVKPEDVSRFGESIYAEARRMIALVEDIMDLSRLDEGAGGMEWEAVDLHALAEAAVRGLGPAAERAGVTLSVSGGTAVLRGVRPLLNAIVCNLCDNGVKYNRPGGHVDVTVTRSPENVRLTVEDTGIGIPREHRERVFERFYRVDKSHSKAVGGTGLGLSIVKHAARVHDASVFLESEPDRGTCICVIFPVRPKE